LIVQGDVLSSRTYRNPGNDRSSIMQLSVNLALCERQGITEWPAWGFGPISQECFNGLS
jgi:hypothetical protein